MYGCCRQFCLVLNFIGLFSVSILNFYRYACSPQAKPLRVFVCMALWHSCKSIHLLTDEFKLLKDFIKMSYYLFCEKKLIILQTLERVTDKFFRGVAEAPEPTEGRDRGTDALMPCAPWMATAHGVAEHERRKSRRDFRTRPRKIIWRPPDTIH
jgi:hypothetical protein